MTWRRAVTVCALSLATSVAVAQTVPQPSLPARGHGIIDVRFGAIERVLAEQGPQSAYFGGHGLPPGTRTDGVAAALRFTRALSAVELQSLQSAGVEWIRRDGRVVRAGTVYGAFVRFDSLAALRAHPDLVFAEVAWHPIVLRPLDATTADIGADRARLAPSIGATGEGTLTCDLDSGVDVLHPHLFFADGGAYAWVDVDADGKFTSGVDQIDLDRNGVGEFNEVAHVLDQATFAEGELTDDDGVLNVAIDWIYIDANSDLERNVGSEAGFTEFDPGYGEPTFVPDDANRNGQLDLDERVLLLSTSKVRRYLTASRTYVRGEDLIEAAGGEQLFHGSAVASILVGGHPARQRSGVAPGAELAMYSAHIDATGGTFEEPGQLAGIAAAIEDGCDVLVHEWTNPYTSPMDGSGNVEEAMLNARNAGVVQINPVGNMNLSEKHAEISAPANTPTPMTFAVGDGFVANGQTYPYSSLYGSVNWRGDQAPTFVVRNPDGQEVTLDGSTTIFPIGANNVQGTINESLRGTWQLRLVIWNEDFDVGIVPGNWTLEVTTSSPDTFVGRIADFWSGWARGVRWETPTTNHNTAVYPSTADAAFGVAAYAGRSAIAADGSDVGELRNYSGRGPRIDGARIVDLAAPDDPFAAWGVTPAWVESGAGRSWFTRFGGTSGAAPHVAGTVAIMRALDPTLTPDQIEARLLAAVRTEAQMPPLPDSAWGSGKLDTYASVFGVPAEPNSAPIASLRAADSGGVTAADSSDSDGDALSFRWDLDYDGEWDTDWTDQTDFAAEGGQTIRLEVRDGRGGAGGAVLRLMQDVPMEPRPPADMGTRDMSDSVGAPDIGGLDLIDEPPPCGCSSAGESATWTLLVAVLFCTRRRRT